MLLLRLFSLLSILRSSAAVSARCQCHAKATFSYAEHRAGGEETVSGGQFRASRRGSVWRWKDEERGTSKSTCRSERVENS